MKSLENAIIFATTAHDGQYRKKSDVPYIVHPFAVSMLLLKEGCSDKIVIAGLLHDTLEDTHVTFDTLVKEFGQEIADIVQACSEPDRKASWQARKQHTIDAIYDAPMPVKYVTCADKLHNISSMLNDYKYLGDTLWDRFREGYEKQKWYYQSMVQGIWNGIDKRLLEDDSIFYRFEKKVIEMFGNTTSRTEQ